MRQIKLKSKAFSLLLIIGVSPIASGALNKVYPLSATAELRINTYVDAISTIYNSTYTIHGSTQMVRDIKLRWINEVLDNDIEQYMVWPSTTCPADWKGWGLQVINGKNVPIPCSK